VNVLLTGGTGFLGQRLIPRLIAAGHSVKALARSRASADALRKLGAEPVDGDLDRPRALKLPPVDAVVHAAAYFRLAGPRRPYFKTNVEGTRSLIAAAKKVGVKHFVAIGAAAVVMDDRGSPVIDVDERVPTFPNSFSAYIASKSQAEKLILSANASGFRTLVLRPPGIWGSGDAFSQALPRLVKSGQFGFVGGGDYPYVTCHVDNVAEGVVAALGATVGGRPYFINDADVTTFRDFATTIASAIGLDISRSRSMSYGVAWQLARVMEVLWALGGAREDPPLSRSMVRLIGRPFTTRDAAARADLGYRSKVSRAEGLAAYKP
jgi:nucleoside-diphosphate-sugar epimerase